MVPVKHDKSHPLPFINASNFKKITTPTNEVAACPWKTVDICALVDRNAMNTAFIIFSQLTKSAIFVNSHLPPLISVHRMKFGEMTTNSYI